jgi:hypothetical protein
VLQVGDHKVSSRTELKTLEPTWNETMCFGPADIAEAFEGDKEEQAAPVKHMGPSCPPWRCPTAHLPLDALCISLRIALSPAGAGGRPFISLRIFDWDLVSADDFLGQCELPLDGVAPASASYASDGSGSACVRPRWLPLYGFARGGRRVDAGEVQVAAWFQASDGGEEQGGQYDSGSAGLANPGLVTWQSSCAP